MWRGSPLLLWGGLTAALAGYAFRDLLLFDPVAALPEELQSWLFMPSDTSPAIILLLAAWLLYRRWGRLAALPPATGSPVGVAVAWILSLSAYAWGSYTGSLGLHVVSLALLAAGGVTLLRGRAGLRAAALPIVFLLFAIPMPPPLLNSVVFRFQLWTADLSGLLLYLAGLPAFVTGDQILREGDTFTIVEGCSGMRSVETLTMLAVLMVDLFRRHGGHALLLVLVAPPMAFVLNGFRALFLMLNPLSETVAIHNAQGIAILLGGVLLLFALDGALAWLLPASPAPARPRAAPGVGGVAWRHALLASSAAGVLALLSVAVPPWDPGPPTLVRLEPRIPSEIDGWRGIELERPDLGVFLGRVGFTDRLLRRYARPDRSGPPLELFVGVTDHRDGLRASLSPKTLYPGSGWVVDEAGTRELEPLGREVEYRLLRSGRTRMLVYHWREGSLGVLGESLRAFLALDRSPVRRDRLGLVVRLSTELAGPGASGQAEAERILGAFSEAIAPALTPLGGPGKDFHDFPDLGKSFPRRDAQRLSKSQ